MAVLARMAKKILPEPKVYIGVALPKAKVWRFFSKLISAAPQHSSNKFGSAFGLHEN